VADRVVLAYSGGLDSSVAIGRLREAAGKDVVALAVGVGQGGEDLRAIRQRALDCGAVESVVVDAEDEFADEHLVPALQANALHHGNDPLVSALSRPLIAAHLARAAKQFGADSVAHGCTGRGDDQVRFEAAVAALAPGLSCLAPVRDLPVDRDEAVGFAREHGLPVGESGTPSSVDQNVWGRTVQGGVLEDPWSAPTEDLYAYTQDPALPQDPDEVTLTFERGVPVAIDGQRFSFLRVLQELNAVAGKHGVGRADLVQDRLVGVKTREVHEAPAAVTLVTAHRELEDLTVERDVLRFKRTVESEWADLVHDGLWFGGLRRALGAFVEDTQQHVSGEVRVRLHGGRAVVTGRRSAQSLYDFELASAATDQVGPDRSGADTGRPEARRTGGGAAAEGFAALWSLPGSIAARRDLAN